MNILIESMTILLENFIEWGWSKILWVFVVAIWNITSNKWKSRPAQGGWPSAGALQ